MYLTYLFFLSRLALALTQWYEPSAKEVVISQQQQQQRQHSSNEAFSARSTIECTLKCQLTATILEIESVFVEKDQKCFCLSPGDNEIEASTDDGVVAHSTPHKLCPKKSCKEVKKVCPKCGSGFYTMEFDEATKVYCDMTTEQGGWLMVGNVTVTSSPFSTSNLQLNTLSDLHNVQGGEFLLKVALLTDLQTYTGFTEVRVMCYKTGHKRKVHAIVYGEQVMQMIVGVSYFHGYCQQIRFLSDDTSSLRQNYGCSDLRGGYWNEKSLYERVIWVYSGPLVWLTSDGARAECDDISYLGGFSKYGQFQFYVR
ncbi:uncharacterized protein [Clytia hemisphaerica]|uniref:Fibrinogen C-terminal domain-containing protein n=1 Tax=Clytia hemisphaerica TaxID=252671 RepID=A0A7M5UU01_9CNID